MHGPQSTSKKGWKPNLPENRKDKSWGLIDNSLPPFMVSFSKDKGLCVRGLVHRDHDQAVSIYQQFY